jgi:hypothetical protein
MDDVHARLSTLTRDTRASLEAKLVEAAASNRQPELGEHTLDGLALLAEAMFRAPEIRDVQSASMGRLSLFARLLKRTAESPDGDRARALATSFLASVASAQIGTYYEFLAEVRDLPAALAAALEKRPFAESLAAYQFCVSKGLKVAPARSGLSKKALALVGRIEALIEKEARGTSSVGSGDAFLAEVDAELPVLREVVRARCASSRLSRDVQRLGGLALARAEALAGEPVSSEAREALVLVLVNPYHVRQALPAILRALPEPTREAVLIEALGRPAYLAIHAAGPYAHLAPGALPALLATHDRTTLGKGQKPDAMVADLVAFGPGAAVAIAERQHGRTPLGMEVAARALVEIGTVECGPALVEMLGEGKAVQLAAIHALTKLGASVAPALEAGANSKKKAVREACATLLGTMPSSTAAPRGATSTAASASASPAPSSDPVAAVFAELTQLKDGQRAEIEAALREPNGAKRKTQLGKLVSRGRGLHALASLRAWKNMDSALSAYDELLQQLRKKEGELACAVAVQALVGRDKPPGHRVKYYLEPLAATRGRAPDALPGLLRALSGPDFPLRTELFELFVTLLTPTSIEPARIEAVLIAGLSDESKRVRELAASELGKRGAAVVPQVASLLSSKRVDVRIAAADALLTLRNAEAAPLLRQALADEKKAPAAAAMERALAACGEAPVTASSGDPLAELAVTKRAKLPTWLTPVLRPVALKAGGALEGDALSAFVTRLMNEGPDAEDALARAVRPLLDDAAAHILSASIFAAWVQKSDPKHKWAVYQQAILASDARIAELGANVAAGNHHYAAWCIDVLVRRGLSDSSVPSVGLSWVAHWARAAETPSLATKAREALELIAARLGCTLSTLGPAVDPDIREASRDAAIPTFDLPRMLDLGARTVEVSVGPLTKLVVSTSKGGKATKGASSKASSKAKIEIEKTDDPTKVARAQRELEQLSERFDAAVKHEVARLEQAMISGRRFRPEAFAALFVSHPWMGKLGERVLFMTETRQLFVLREGSPLGLDYGRVKIDSPVRVAHREELTSAEAAAWATHLAESEVIELFPQLSRPPFEGPLDLSKTITPQMLAARLLERGFRFGRAEDAGNVFVSTKLFPGRGQRAVVQHSAINVQGNDWNKDPASIRSVSFSGLYDRTERLPEASVDPVVRAEVGRDVRAILR